MATIRIFENTPLSFVAGWQQTDLQTELNRFDAHYLYQSKMDIPYCPVFEQGDPLFFQVRTDYDNLTAQLISESGVVSTLVVSLLKVYEGDKNWKQYQIDGSTELMNGRYKIVLSGEDEGKPLFNMISRPFEVVEQIDYRYLKIKWFGSDALNDPFIWVDKWATVNIIATLKNRDFGEQDKNTYVVSDGHPEITYAMPQNNRNLVCDFVPEWFMNVLNLAIMHDNLEVNGVAYSTGNTWDAKPTENRMYAPKITLTQKNYYNFGNDFEVKGDLPVIEDVVISAGDGLVMAYNDGGTLIKFNN